MTPALRVPQIDLEAAQALAKAVPYAFLAALIFPFYSQDAGMATQATTLAIGGVVNVLAGLLTNKLQEHIDLARDLPDEGVRNQHLARATAATIAAIIRRHHDGALKNPKLAQAFDDLVERLWLEALGTQNLHFEGLREHRLADFLVPHAQGQEVLVLEQQNWLEFLRILKHQNSPLLQSLDLGPTMADLLVTEFWAEFLDQTKNREKAFKGLMLMSAGQLRNVSDRPATGDFTDEQINTLELIHAESEKQLFLIAQSIDAVATRVEDAYALLSAQGPLLQSVKDDTEDILALLQEFYGAFLAAQRPPAYADTPLPHIVFDLWPRLADGLLKEREEPLRRIGEHFDGASHPLPYVIPGIGAVGKTRLAVEYAQSRRDAYDAIFFLNATTLESLDYSLRKLAQTTLPDLATAIDHEQNRRLLGQPDRDSPPLPDLLDALAQQLKAQSKYLLIFDDVDTIAARDAVLKLQPHLYKGHVLITSQLHEWKTEVSVGDSLEELSEPAATKFLLDRTAGRRKESDEDESLALQLVHERLTGLPRYLENAAAWVCENVDPQTGDSLGLLDLHDRLATNAPLPAAGEDRYAKAGEQTWALVIESLSEPALGLLQLLSWCASADIPQNLIQAFVGQLPAESAGLPLLPGPLLQELRRFHLLPPAKANRIEVQSQLASELRGSQEKNDLKCGILLRAVAACEAVVPEVDYWTHSDWTGWRASWESAQSHVAAVLHFSQGCPPSDSVLPLHLASLLFLQSEFAGAQGQLDAWQGSINATDTPSLLFAWSHYLLGRIAQEQKRWEKADRQFALAAGIADNKEPKLWSALGTSLYQRGWIASLKPEPDWQAADNWYEAAVEAHMEAEPRDWTWIGRNLHARGYVATHQLEPDWVAADDWYSQAVDAKMQATPRDRAEIGRSFYQRGYVAIQQPAPDWVAADEWCHQAIETCEQATVHEWALIGSSLQLRGFVAINKPEPDWVAADDWYRRAIEVYEKAEPRDWTLIGMSFYQRGYVAYDKPEPDWGAADDWSRQAIEAYERRTPRDWTEIGKSLHQRGYVAFRQRNIFQAIEWITEAIEALNSAPKPDEPLLEQYTSELEWLRTL